MNAFVSVNRAVKDIAGGVEVFGIGWMLLNLGDFFFAVRGARTFQDFKQFQHDFGRTFALYFSD